MPVWSAITFGLLVPVAVVFLIYGTKRSGAPSPRKHGHKRPFAVIGGIVGRGVFGRSRSEDRACPTCGTALPSNAPHGLCPKCLLQEAMSSLDVSTPPKNAASTGPYAGTGTIPPPEALGQFFPQLEILGLLGQGGMGAVYKARQVKLDRLVAVKILPPSAGQDPAFAERFMREARALARVNHPQIVTVHDFGEAGGMYYFLMEYVDGVNLRQLMQSGRLTPEKALPIVGQICDALQYAHEEGIIHRDIKPENILLDQKGRVKIADFGLAKLVGPSLGSFMLTGSQQAMGTPHYMAPEQMEQPLTVDQRADIYSLGVLFYEMLTGELPLGHFALPSQKAAVDERLDAIVLRALERDPERRYQRISELKTAITGTGAVMTPAAAQSLPNASYQEEVDSELQRIQVALPGVCLILSGILVFANLTGVLVALLLGVNHGREFREDDFILFGAGLAVIIVLAGIIITGGRRMMKFESYGLASLSVLLAMCVSLPWAMLVVIPIGIWVLGVLRRPEIRLIFAKKAVQVRLSNAGVPAPAHTTISATLGRVVAFILLVIGVGFLVWTGVTDFRGETLRAPFGSDIITQIGEGFGWSAGFLVGGAVALLLSTARPSRPSFGRALTTIPAVIMLGIGFGFLVWASVTILRDEPVRAPFGSDVITTVGEAFGWATGLLIVGAIAFAFALPDGSCGLNPKVDSVLGAFRSLVIGSRVAGSAGQSSASPRSGPR